MKISLFFNGTVLTFDNNDSEFDALAIYQDKILFIGSENEVREKTTHYINEQGTGTSEELSLEEIDLNGKLVVPGFIDSHMHPILAIYFKTQLSASKIKSYSELSKLIMEKAQKKGEGDWICCLDFMEERLSNPKEQFFPDKRDLDKIWSKNPIILLRHDGHICSVNSLALEKIGISKSNIAQFQSESGEIKTLKNGEPSGIFTERATTIALDNLPVPNMDDFKEACLDFSQEFASYGITTIGGMLQTDEIGISGSMGAMEVPLMQTFIKEGILEQDYVFYLDVKKPKKLMRFAKSFDRLSGNSGKYKIGGIKIFADGGFGARTAYMFEPFSDSQEKEIGFLVISQEDLYKRIEETFDLGFQVACHSIGDKSNKILVDLYKKFTDARLLKDTSSETNQIDRKNQNPFRIEHASAITEETLKEAAKVGIIISTQPGFIDSEYEWLEKRLGPERIKYVYPFRSIIDAGITIAGASDHPIESGNVLNAIQTCVIRQGFVVEQSISPYEALKMYTYNAACAINQQDIKGSLEPGKFADIVIIENDIRKIPSDQIGSAKIMNTFHRGKRIF